MDTADLIAADAAVTVQNIVHYAAETEGKIGIIHALPAVEAELFLARISGKQ